VRVVIQDINSLIRRDCVYHNMFHLDAVTSLIHHAFYAVRNKAALIEAGGNDGKFHRKFLPN
jgi:hypothetical protein